MGKSSDNKTNNYAPLISWNSQKEPTNEDAWREYEFTIFSQVDTHRGVFFIFVL